LKKEDRKGLAMIVDEQIEALESDDFSKGNHQLVKILKQVAKPILNQHYGVP
jgi:cardiolipin synthase